MRPITPELTDDLHAYVGAYSMSEADAFPIYSYQQLVEHAAGLAYLNKDHLIYYRGQSRDFRNKAGSSTIYPSIYRGEYVRHEEIFHRFQMLDEASRQLSNLFEAESIRGYNELIRKTFIQWSILQHYEVCDTPLLDLTQSLSVACSFAQHFSDDDFAYVFMFGLPYLTGRISINSEHDLVNVRLLSICPPDALRPYFQEGYLAGTTDIRSEYRSKTELDFRNRLIAKFRIVNGSSFWHNGFASIPEEVLFPQNDRVRNLCKSIELRLEEELLPGDIGSFVKHWSELEQQLVEWSRQYSDRIHSAAPAISTLSKVGQIDPDLAGTLHELRKFRNVLVHEPERVQEGEIALRLVEVRNVMETLRKKGPQRYRKQPQDDDSTNY